MRFIGYYQIVGGIIGIFGTLGLFIDEHALGGLHILFYALGFSLFSFSIYCGNLLRKTELKGLTLSFWNQAVQILQFCIFSIAFSYFSGARISFGFEWTESFGPDIIFSISSFSVKYTPHHTDEFYLYINIVPIIIISYLIKLEEDFEKRKQLLELD
ncbi:hypothetical protein C3K47_06125 [Solitalea longa]|uniref:Uncharacterized protein n=2 Tax=Solitalea longa TaxID=2079460 RepID=A0A2S5A434_9SPHI|nr:hypothetical protein C3K47_06125 [Solitalea longa]